jgi:hypothetical protein
VIDYFLKTVYNNTMTHGIIAQEVGELFPEMFIVDKPQPTPLLSITSPPENNIIFHTGKSETLRVAEDGFYVRGVKVPVDDNEALAVYKAFKEFLVYHALTRN